MELFFRKYGQGPPMIILHGLYGMSDNWVSVARHFSKRFEVWTLDQRNHGDSPHDSGHDYELMANDLLEFMDRHQIDQAILIGHSMGGKTVMKFSGLHPNRVSSLFVVDIAPKSYLEAARSSKGYLSHYDIMKAMCKLKPEDMSSREEIAAQLVKSLKSERIVQFLMKNIARNRKNGFRWKLNLEVLRTHLENIMHGVHYDELLSHSPITGFPVLFIRGGDSSYILQDDEEKIKWIYPYSEIETIPSASHWVHAEQPESFVNLIDDFLSH